MVSQRWIVLRKQRLKYSETVGSVIWLVGVGGRRMRAKLSGRHITSMQESSYKGNGLPKLESGPRQQDQFKVKLGRPGLRAPFISSTPMPTTHPQFPVGLMSIMATAFQTHLYVCIHSPSQPGRDPNSFQFIY